MAKILTIFIALVYIICASVNIWCISFGAPEQIIVGTFCLVWTLFTFFSSISTLIKCWNI